MENDLVLVFFLYCALPHRCPIPQATSMALTAFPPLNASLSEDKKSLLQHPSHNIGVAMDTSRGLLVPCISSVEEMSVLDIAKVCSLLLLLFCCCGCWYVNCLPTVEAVPFTAPRLKTAVGSIPIISPPLTPPTPSPVPAFP